ncbi:MAG: hypothetical protein AB1478_05455 [Nitrospirota bacterium]
MMHIKKYIAYIVICSFMILTSLASAEESVVDTVYNLPGEGINLNLSKEQNPEPGAEAQLETQAPVEEQLIVEQANEEGTPTVIEEVYQEPVPSVIEVQPKVTEHTFIPSFRGEEEFYLPESGEGEVNLVGINGVPETLEMIIIANDIEVAQIQGGTIQYCKPFKATGSIKIRTKLCGYGSLDNIRLLFTHTGL